MSTSNTKNWNHFSVNLKQSDPKTSTAFYLNNSTGNHFDPVLTSLNGNVKNLNAT